MQEALSLLSSPDELKQYDAWVGGHRQGSLWQSLAWKHYQEALGRIVRVYATLEGEQIVASALVVIDATRGGWTTWEIPRGPLWSDDLDGYKKKAFLEHILDHARAERCLSLYLSPFFLLSADDRRLQSSTRHIYPEATRILDLTLSDEQLLGQMHQKGRYNIRLAQKNGVTVSLITKESPEFEQQIAHYAVLAQMTAKRDGFTAGNTKRYGAFLMTIPHSFLLLATHASAGGEPIAGLIGLVWKQTGIYYYGASDSTHRALMAPYLLQREAMRHCRAQSCTQYDLFGIAPPGAAPSHPWHGVSTFKEKFGGSIVVYPPEQVIVLKPWMDRLLRLKRRVW